MREAEEIGGFANPNAPALPAWSRTQESLLAAGTRGGPNSQRLGTASQPTPLLVAGFLLSQPPEFATDRGIAEVERVARQTHLDLAHQSPSA